jgi:glycosyltransferase involved in cell wall biosynthesis
MKDSSGKTPILIVVENLPVPLDRRVWQESCALRDAGFDVTVVCPKMRGFTKSFEVMEGIRIYRHWITEEAGGFFGFFGEYLSALVGETRLAWKAWLKHRFKVIHICNPPDLLFLVAAPFKLLGASVIYDVHDLWPEMYRAKFNRKGPFFRLVKIAERLTYAVADVVMTTNNSVRRVAEGRGGKKKGRVFVVRTSPKVRAHDADVDESLRNGRKFLVGYIGVMGNTDGVHLLLDVIRQVVVKKGRTDIQFLLMGTGPEFDRLVQVKDDLGLGDFVDMPGKVTNEFLFSALKTMDVGVSCDPSDGYNDHCTMNKVLEYMAFGKAQVMFDLEEGRASAGEASVYVRDNSTSQFVDVLVELLDDPEKRAAMGRVGLERVNGDLRWERSVEQMLEAYDVALGGEN